MGPDRHDQIAYFDGRTLVLPKFTVLQTQQDPPHRRRVLAAKDIDGVRYEVSSNWPRSRFYVRASQGMFRAARSCATGDHEKASAWIDAINSADVRIA